MSISAPLAKLLVAKSSVMVLVDPSTSTLTFDESALFELVGSTCIVYELLSPSISNTPVKESAVISPL